MNVISHFDFEPTIAGIPERLANKWGFRWGEIGTHTSRTIMLEDLECLLKATDPQASRKDYANAVVEENCLGKRTASTRKISLQHLRELYALDPGVLLYRVLRKLWDRRDHGHALLALLLALARDPLLRATAAAVSRTPPGHEFARQPMKDALSKVVGDRLNSSTLDKVVRNAASSWTQSGHLKGRSRKTRQRVEATPIATTYALLLGFATGRRDRFLFETPWCAVLDASPGELMELAGAARRLGLLDLKQAGSVFDVSFPALLAGAEKELARGAY